MLYRHSNRASKPSTGRAFRGLLLCVSLFLLPLQATPPRIEHLERYILGGMLIHFSADAGRLYTVQYTDNPTNGASWSNLWTMEQPYPIEQHLIILDPESRVKQRFYRLKVTP